LDRDQFQEWVVLERFDLKRDCRLGEEKVFRRLAKIQMLSNGPKYFEAKSFPAGPRDDYPQKRPDRGKHRSFH
jgi:hypothetical protein